MIDTRRQVDTPRDSSPASDLDTVVPGKPLSHKFTPEEVFRLLEQRYGRERPESDQRQWPRKRWVVDLRVSVHEGAEFREVRVLTHDISVGGIGFVHPQFINLGTTLQIRFDTLAGEPVLTCVVVSCDHVGGMLYRVGAKFVARINGRPNPAPSLSSTQEG